MASRDKSSAGTEEELEALCQSCGLCCDGSLFGRVPLQPAEVLLARRRRLGVLENGAAFEQPCVALAEQESERRSCSIYRDRPRSCRAFVCRLHDRHRNEGGPLEARLVAVRRVRQLLSELAASSPKTVDPEGFAELTRRLEEDFARA